MLIDNRFGGPVHIPRVIHNDDGSTAHAGVLTLPPGICEIADFLWEGATTCANPKHSLPPVLKDLLKHYIFPVDAEEAESNPLSIIPRIFSRDLLAPYLNHEDQAVRRAALEQDDLNKSRTGG